MAKIHSVAALCDLLHELKDNYTESREAFKKKGRYRMASKHHDKAFALADLVADIELSPGITLEKIDEMVSERKEAALKETKDAIDANNYPAYRMSSIVALLCDNINLAINVDDEHLRCF